MVPSTALDGDINKVPTRWSQTPGWGVVTKLGEVCVAFGTSQRAACFSARRLEPHVVVRKHCHSEFCIIQDLSDCRMDTSGSVVPVMSPWPRYPLFISCTSDQVLLAI